jgi:hypothetical protein
MRYVGAAFYPEGIAFRVSLCVGSNETPLTIDEARALAQELLDTAREAEGAGEHYVQVQFNARPYTYVDPTGELKIGDQVTVNGAYSGQVGTVIRYGRDGYTGDVYAEVVAVVRPL